MIKRIFLPMLFAASLSINQANAAKVDTVTTYSEAMKKSIRAVVITPDSYSNDKTYPVVYLLHGAGDNYSGWIKKAPTVAMTADQYQQIIVCPDGNVTSWYFDSPVNKAWKYETYVTKELIPFIDGHYRTIRDRKGRAITGLSMGGHGALYLAFRHQDLFGAAGSMSGGVDIRPFPKNWKIEEKLGSYAEYPENWERNTVTNMLNLLSPGSLALIIDCGTEDFFYKVNVNLHDKMLERNIQHDFITRPGGHTWPYWANAVKYQMLYMSLYFTRD
ncbi:MAG: alpha/beta hydrolase family protein [Pedobacter sp.]|uniref:alpha/beta hydrolase n=1 Tax=Pedobacter sp. TaxID=1411316 RepID=UPI003398769A